MLSYSKHLFDNIYLSILVIIGIFISGIGLLLIAPQWHVSPLWIPSGIAIAALLHWGRRVLAGVFLGSFWLNLWVVFNMVDNHDPGVFYSAAGIALGSSIQAFFAAWSIKKYFRKKITGLDTLTSIASFLFLIGPLASLISPTIGIVSLMMTGIISQTIATDLWAPWWASNSLGAVTITPLLLCFFAGQSQLWKSRRLTYALPMTLALCIFMLGLSEVYRQEQRHMQQLFDSQAIQIEQQIKNQVAAIIDGVQTTVAYFDSSNKVERSKFTIFTDQILGIHPSLSSLAWTPMVKGNQINHFESDAQKSGLAEFRITERDTTGALVPVRPENVHFPVFYIEPIKGNEKILGYDLFSERKIRQALEKSHSTGQFTITEQRQFAWETGNDISMLATAPVYVTEENSKNLIGFITGVVRVSSLIANAIAGLDTRGLLISLRDQNVSAETVDLYTTLNSAGVNVNPYIQAHVEPILVGERSWIFMLRPDADYVSRHGSWIPWLTLAGGNCVLILLSTMILTVTGYTARVRKAVVIRTQELRKSEKKLQTIINASPVPFAISDDAQNITYLNPAFTRVFGYSLSAIPTLSHWWQLACPNAQYRQWVMQTWQEHLTRAKQDCPEFDPMELMIHCKDGSVKTVIGSVSSLTENFADSYLVSLFDITERKSAEEELRLAYAVYQNSSEAMLICDANNCIIAVNPAFTNVTGYSAEEVIGKNPRVLSSGRQSAEFYRDMWHSITTTGRWQGEIVDRRKNGEEYTEFLTINTIYNDDGTIHRRIALFSDITEKKKADALIWTHANYDALTNLPNRRLFTDRLEREIIKSQRDHSLFALLFIDIDHFKEVNDILGHHVGDELLIEATRRIRHCVREADTLARLGGDEFTVILSEIKDPSDTGIIAQNILNALARPVQLGEEQVFVSASIGITFYPADARTAATLLQNADQAMYAAKQQGRNCFSCFTPSLQESAIIRMRLARDIRQALVENQFETYFQPIVELATGSIRKAEALLRWKHPEQGYISPATFIPIAEETGTINEIGDWVFRQAVDELIQLKTLMDLDFQISVNKSPVQFRKTDGIHNHWGEYLSEHGLPGDSIVVEITEGLLLNAEQKIQDQFFYLRDQGIKVAIDDFGTGYSALSYLQKFDIDYLKIDQSFTHNLAPDSDTVVLCEAIIVMAHKLKLKVIAEGIETEQQRDILESMDCDYGQGYLFSRPVPAEEFEQLLLKNRGRLLQDE